MGWIGGQITSELGQDAMLGMLFTGILLRNLFPSIIVPIPHSWTAILWTTALASVISRAGLSLQKHKILPNIIESVFLGIIPVITEGIVIAFVAKLFFGVPPAWAFTLAFGVASISPGVVVPLILKLIDNGWQQSRLPPLLLTALGIDVLVGTSGFGIALAACFGHKHEQENIDHQSWVGRGIEEISMGVMLGLVLGTLGYMYSKFRVPEIVASSLVFVCSSITMIWCKTHGFAGAASCSTFITWGFIANSWSKIDIEKVDTKLKLVWICFKPFLFPVIGSTIPLSDIPFHTFVKCFALVMLAVVIKLASAYITSVVSGLSHEESLFLCGLWTGKASIQATLCGAAIEMVYDLKLDDQVEHQYAKLVFLCMVCAIVVGVPVASSWVAYFGKVPLGVQLVRSTPDE